MYMSRTANFDEAREIAQLENLSKSNPAALRYFYERYAGKIIAFAYSLLGNREDAEDVAHTLFIELWEQRASATRIKSVDAYLYRMARNAITDIARRRTREKAYMMHTDPTSTEPIDPDNVDIEDDLRLLEAIEKLPEPQKSIIRMSRFGGMSYQQIAERLDISPHTVHYHVSKALGTLRRALGCLITLLSINSL